MASPKTALIGLAAASVIALGVAACGDDDNGAGPGPGADASTDRTVTPPGPGNDGGADGGACEFNAYVIGLISGSTTATAVPTENLGDTCTDNQVPFPDTLFQ